MQTLDMQSGVPAAAWRDNTIGTLYEMAKRAPGQPLVLDFGIRKLLLLQDAGHARQVLRQNADNYRKNFGGFQGLFGESRLTSDGARWEFLHRLSQPYINAAPAETVCASAHAAFSRAAEDMLAERDGTGRVVVDAPVNRAAGKVASDVVFGFRSLDVDAVLEELRAMLRYGGQRNWNFDGRQADAPGERERYEAARQRLAAAVAGLVAEDRSALVRDLVAHEADGVDVVAELSSLLFAGFETTASAITWGLMLLAASPDLQGFLREKIKAVLAGGPPTPEGLAQLPELVAFQNEAMRIFPPIPVLGRVAVAADAIEGGRVEAGQVVMVSIIGLHHDARYFPAPAQIRLKRYSDGQLDRALRGHFLPYADGKRACGGARLANLELTAAFATLIPALEFNLADQDPIAFEWTVSLRRKGGQGLLVRPA